MWRARCACGCDVRLCLYAHNVRSSQLIATKGIRDVRDVVK